MELNAHKFDVRHETGNLYVIHRDETDEYCQVIDAGHCYLFEHVECGLGYFADLEEVTDEPMACDMFASYCDAYGIDPEEVME